MSPAVPACPAPPAGSASPDHHAEAVAFALQFHQETGAPDLPGTLTRLDASLASPQADWLTPEQLTFAGRVAWRNSVRCVGRLPWPALHVRDRRTLTDPADVFQDLLSHLSGAFAGGQVRPSLSVYGPGVRILNPQLIRYAGYTRTDGSVLGDPQNAALTAFLQQCGWRPAARPGPFDVLPVAIQAAGEIQLFDLPPDAVQEIPITHPDCPAIAALGLRWHALPVISDMALRAGGQRYLCAPFNGWYVQTEIAARNLADPDRYDQLPAVARALGLDTRRERSLWRDRALVELNVAVLHSFDQAGVKLSDHHAVTAQFTRFEAREARAGREVRARWSWMIPPLSPATTPVWSRSYQGGERTPRYERQPAPWEAPRCPVS